MLRAILAAVVLSSQVTAYDPDHLLWDQWLKEHVIIDKGISRVNYAEANYLLLEQYIREIESLDRATFDALDKAEKTAFLINAHNALSVKLVLNHYPLGSVLNIRTAFKSPWKKKFFTMFGQKHHLQWLLDEVIRKELADGRVHFALNRGAKGFPMLRDEAYVWCQIDNQLDSSRETFMKNKEVNSFVPAESKLKLSKIFDWYRDDFKKLAESLSGFLAHCMTHNSDEQEKIKKVTQYSYIAFDWSLNEETP